MKDFKITDTAVFGGGCFWCTEAVFSQLKGVYNVESGYAGGSLKNPTYNEVCRGTTNHAEVIRIEYNSDEIPFEILLDVFFNTHDPTTLNSQGPDHGTQYRSVIFYTSMVQLNIAGEYIEKLDSLKIFPKKIVTELAKFETFYKAEDYHQDYYSQNSNQRYCQFIIDPKIKKFKKAFSSYLK